MFVQSIFVVFVTETEKPILMPEQIKGNLGKGSAGCTVSDRAVIVIIIVFFTVVSIS